MVPIPIKFLEQTRQLLGREFDAFQATYDQPISNGIRVNTLKISVPDFTALTPYPVIPTPWATEGFSLVSEFADNHGLSPGKHPYHAAGLYYLQDPSAMSATTVLDPQPGELILDLAAAPGGKSTHIASRLENQGLLVANEINMRRAMELAQNLERWGTTNTIILNESPERLAEHLPGVFDKVLLDAPCSGEGMFRKSLAARQDWSPKLVLGCAARQHRLIALAGRLVRPGGRLVYATCTFNPFENEAVIDHFLHSHPEFEITPIPPLPGSSPGRPDWLSQSKASSGYPEERQALTHAMRFWPHLSPGEGHFVICLRRAGAPTKEAFGRLIPNTCSREAQKLVEQFLDDVFSGPRIPKIYQQTGNFVYLVPEHTLHLGGLRVLRPGLWLGTIKPGRFEPAHTLALALDNRLSGLPTLRRKAPVSLVEALRYLHGESLQQEGPPGWLPVTYAGFCLGWGKRAGGIIKNYYPRGLRNLT
jgi:NOL1/NOP2/sun family putative RNA methylase